MSSTPQPLLSTLLRRVHLQVRQQLHDDLHAAGYTDLTPAHIYVFQSPGPDGARPTELAVRSNMTKQAMNHLLSSLEGGGYLERVRVAADGRGKRLRLTQRGRDVERILHESSATLEHEWAAVIGRRRLEDIRSTLVHLDAIGSAPPTPEG